MQRNTSTSWLFVYDFMYKFADARRKYYKRNTMKLTKTQTEAIFTKFGPKKSAQDSGSPESQIGIFTHRINHLTQHLKVHRGDNACKVGLSKLIGKRKGLLAYLQREDIERYRAIVAGLGLRK